MYYNYKQVNFKLEMKVSPCDDLEKMCDVVSQRR